MNKLQLALLTQWAEKAGKPGIQGRKRLQKIAYFLQQAGCPIDADFTLHHYGPYSRDVANVTDVMVAQKLLMESGGHGGPYEYRLAPQTKPMIEAIRGRGDGSLREFERFRELATELLEEDLWLLELGSTIHFCFKQQQSGGWEVPFLDACKYKGVESTLPASIKALELAKRIESRVA